MDFTNLRRFFDNMALKHTPGNAVEFYLNGESVFRYEAGYSNLESKTPLNGKEMYNIYSCSKIATVVAGAQMLERGDFLLNEPLYAYIPEFKHMYVKDTTGNLKEAKNPITIGDLFSMTAGFTYDFNSHGFQKARELTKGKMDEYDSGGAGIITTVSDYAKLMAALANYGTGVNGERILSKYTVNLMRTNRLTTQQQSDFSWKQLAGCGYGLGVRTHTLPEKSGLICRLGEFGWGGAAGATAIVDPEIDLGVFYVQHTLNPREEYSCL